MSGSRFGWVDGFDLVVCFVIEVLFGRCFSLLDLRVCWCYLA